MTYLEYMVASQGRKAYIEKRAAKAGVSVKEYLEPTQLIRHYTTSHCAQLIQASGWVMCESRTLSFDQWGYTNLWDNWNDDYGMKVGDIMQRDWRALGQWVWLSEQMPQCNRARNEVYFEFNARDIGAEKWLDHTANLIQTKQVRDAIRGVEQQLNGDDLNDWWIAPSIDLSKCEYTLHKVKQKEPA